MRMLPGLGWEFLCQTAVISPGNGTESPDAPNPLSDNSDNNKLVVMINSSTRTGRYAAY